MNFYGLNRASREYKLEKINEALEIELESKVPCVFISYQRKDEDFAKSVADYILSKKVDVYFDLGDDNLKFWRQDNNPMKVNDAILKGLVKSQYMIVIISPDTYKSPWVPFEVGYAYDKMMDGLKLLRHKDIGIDTLPSYLRVKEVLYGFKSLNNFISTVKDSYKVYESITERVRTFSEMYVNNPLNKYLENK